MFYSLDPAVPKEIQGELTEKIIKTKATLEAELKAETYVAYVLE